MVAVYSVAFDMEKYQHLLATDTPANQEFGRGESLRRTWRPVTVYSPAPKLAVPDFWCLSPHDGFVLSPALFESLPILGSVGELLPLVYEKRGRRDEDRPLGYFNITHMVDCLDLAKSDYDAGLGWVNAYAFVPEKLKGPLFTILQMAGAVFAVTGLTPSPDSDFLALVKARQLKGLVFKKVWEA